MKKKIRKNFDPTPVDWGKAINVDALRKLSREQIHELYLLTRNL